MTGESRSVLLVTHAARPDVRALATQVAAALAADGIDVRVCSDEVAEI